MTTHDSDHVYRDDKNRFKIFKSDLFEFSILIAHNADRSSLVHDLVFRFVSLSRNSGIASKPGGWGKAENIRQPQKSNARTCRRTSSRSARFSIPQPPERRADRREKTELHDAELFLESTPRVAMPLIPSVAVPYLVPAPLAYGDPRTTASPIGLTPELPCR